MSYDNRFGIFDELNNITNVYFSEQFGLIAIRVDHGSMGSHRNYHDIESARKLAAGIILVCDRAEDLKSTKTNSN